MQETVEAGAVVDKAIRSALKEQDWEDIFRRLTAHAQRLIKALTWRGEWGGFVPGGHEATDFAMEAILDLYTGVRKWDPMTQPNLLAHLQNIVRSKISNAVRSSENRAELRESEEEAGSQQDPYDTFILDLLDYLDDEPILQKVVECLADGYTDRADITDRLGIEAMEVTNLRKKLARRIRDFRQLR